MKYSLVILVLACILSIGTISAQYAAREFYMGMGGGSCEQSMLLTTEVQLFKICVPFFGNAPFGMVAPVSGKKYEIKLQRLILISVETALIVSSCEDKECTMCNVTDATVNECVSEGNNFFMWKTVSGTLSSLQ